MAAAVGDASMKHFAIALMLCLPAASYGQSRKTFDSPQEAAEAAIHAAEQNDEASLAAIFGPGAKAILSTGDAEQDRKEREQFAKLALSRHQLEKDPMSLNRMILVVGSEDWPFPIPIVRANGKWGFDATLGTLEVRARRIGANELDTIEICAGYVQAQEQYATRVHDQHGMLEYAQHLSGATHALYGQGDEKSLIPKRFAEAEGGPKPTPYHGYYFRVLTAQGLNAPGGAHNYLVKDSMIGGFALVAWPAQYGVTGVHTFIVNQDGAVFEKNLGAGVHRVTTFDPDKTWTRVD
ncbi:MAG: hypothetical protein JWO80_108 [Bryobacterales bacterium]|nr:hypothetical protein [Bryobacterales bacterium]